MTILLIAEHDNETLSDQTNKALTAAKEIGGDVHVLVAGKDAQAAGIDRKTFVEAEFGTEVSHQGLFRIELLRHFRAGASLKIGIVATQNPTILGQKRPVFSRFIKSILGNAPQEKLRVVLDFLP